jgi:hypothetical protein
LPSGWLSQKSVNVILVQNASPRLALYQRNFVAGQLSEGYHSHDRTHTLYQTEAKTLKYRSSEYRPLPTNLLQITENSLLSENTISGDGLKGKAIRAEKPACAAEVPKPSGPCSTTRRHGLPRSHRRAGV